MYPDVIADAWPVVIPVTNCYLLVYPTVRTDSLGGDQGTETMLYEQAGTNVGRYDLERTKLWA